MQLSSPASVSEEIKKFRSFRKDKGHVAASAVLAFLSIKFAHNGGGTFIETGLISEKITKFIKYFKDTWLNNLSLP